MYLLLAQTKENVHIIMIFKKVLKTDNTWMI